MTEDSIPFTSSASQNLTTDYSQEGDKKIRSKYFSVNKQKTGFNECDVFLDTDLTCLVELVRSILKKRRYVSIFFYSKKSINPYDLENFKEKILENIFYYKEKKDKKENCLFEIIKIKL
ncbi:hypothetical protein EHP00_1140 [Ecytonucleospora hepatopenaei]|uniref:Uncharacterized protein n=1 Tax=Ecytonucleospora hepatopenaei TaxID=646526 RepID=A0A1W0E4K6_9MICR|nr:hypothetical protein EHP00_1140 [Ecytonucleospora hepatopenaei]